IAKDATMTFGILGLLDRSPAKKPRENASQIPSQNHRRSTKNQDHPAHSLLAPKMSRASHGAGTNDRPRPSTQPVESFATMKYARKPVTITPRATPTAIGISILRR